jgi:hypothetical protein
MLTNGTDFCKNVAIVYFDAASGHRSAAAAIKKALLRVRPEYKVSMINIVDVFDHHPLFGKLVRTGIDYFNWQIKRDQVFDLKGLIHLSLLCHDLVRSTGIKRIANYWKSSPPDCIVSVTPMYNPVLYKSALLVNPDVKCITIPVDFEEVTPRYWFTPTVNQYYINATDRLQEQCVAAGIPSDLTFKIGGMPADEDGYLVPQEDREQRLKALGLDAALPTGFLSFGGQGTSNVLDIARELAKSSLRTNMIIMCGKNKKLYQQVNALATPFPKAVFSYLPDAPINYLHLADFAIGKPGAMTITESLITKTPLIALKSKGMSPVQKGNEDWMAYTRTGIVAKTPLDVVAAINEVLTNPIYNEQIKKHHHESIHECVALIDQLIYFKQPFHA